MGKFKISALTLASMFSFLILNDTALANGKPAQEAGSVRFLQPANGATVAPKFKVKMDVKGFKVDPAGAIVKGKGHHHLIIDGGPIPKGQVVPADAKHIHYGKGQTETELELTPGPHKLTLQFADGAHISYGPEMSESIDVIVSADTKK